MFAPYKEKKMTVQTSPESAVVDDGYTTKRYEHTSAELDYLLERFPDIANNWFHSDRLFAIANCPGATNRIVPASLTCQDLDDFICRYFSRSHNILARDFHTKLKNQPVCVGDVTFFRVIEENPRHGFTDMEIHNFKLDGDNEIIIQIHTVRLILVMKDSQPDYL